MDQTKQVDSNLANFDQVPIGTNTNFGISEYAKNESDNFLEEYRNMPLGEKIRSKTIKVKLEGLEDLRNKLSSDPLTQIPEQQDHPFQINKILKQSNPACLDKALQCFLIWMEADRHWGTKQIKELIESGFINGKANSKKLATEIIYQAFAKKPAEVESTILDGFKAKVPKLIGGYLCCLNQILVQFGIKKVGYLKPYISEIIRVMNSEKQICVKNEGMNLLKNGYKSIGKDFFVPQLGNLKENMRKQLDAFWDSHDKSDALIVRRDQKSNKLTANQEPLTSNNEAKINNVSCNDKKLKPSVIKNNQKIDVYEISEEVQIFNNHFTEKWTQQVLQAEKWNLKTKFLQQMTSKCQVPKIKPTEHRHIMEMLRRLLNDSNFNVVLCSLKLIEALSRGLRKNFNSCGKMLFSQISGKLRDKKTQMIQQTKAVLETLSEYTLGVEEVAEQLKTGLKDKSAGMRNNLVIWFSDYLQKIIRCQDDSSQSKNTHILTEKMEDFLRSASLSSIIQNLLNDPNSEVRDSTAILAGKIISIVGQQMQKRLYKNLNNKSIVMNKVIDAKVNIGNDDSLILERSRKKNNKSLSQNKRNSSVSKQSQAQAKINQTNPSIISHNNSFYTVKQGCTNITELIERNLKKLNDTNNWQNRKESCQNLIKYFETQPLSTVVHMDNINDFMAILKNRIGDPNKQLVKLFISLIGWVFQFIADKQAKVNARNMVATLCEVFSDKNEANRRQVYSTLNKISQKVSVEYLVGILGTVLSTENSLMKLYVLEYLLMAIFAENKNEPDTSENNSFLLDSFDQGSLIREMKEYPKNILNGLCDKNKDVKAASEKLFKIMCEKMNVKVETFRAEVKYQKESHQKDLQLFLDRYWPDGGQLQKNVKGNKESSFCEQPNYDSNKIGKTPPIQSKMKRNTSRSKSKFTNNTANLNKSNIKSGPNHNSEHSNSTNNQIASNNDQYKIKPNQYFVQVELLKKHRMEREETAMRYRNKVAHPINSETQIQKQIKLLCSQPLLTSYMLSYNYSHVLEAVQKLSKLCKDVEMWVPLREMYDLLVKWMGLRMYGGYCGVPAVAEGLFCGLLPVLLSVQLKNNTLSTVGSRRCNSVFSDVQIEQFFLVMRDFIMCVSSWGDKKWYEKTITQTLKMLIQLSSGDRIIHRILIELSSFCKVMKDQGKEDYPIYEFFATHQHLYINKDKRIDQYYTELLVSVSCELVEYFSNGGLLEEASKIKSLKQSKRFTKLLQHRFHAGMLKQFGFSVTNNYDSKKSIEQNRMNIRSNDDDLGQVSCTISSSHRSKKMEQEDDERVGQYYKGKVGLKQMKGKNGNRSINLNNTAVNIKRGNEKNNRSVCNMGVSPSHQASKHMLHPRLINHSHNNTTSTPKHGTSTSKNNNNHTISINLTVAPKQKNTSQSEGNYYDLPISDEGYSVPSSHNPLGANLKKLISHPFHQNTLHFFTTLLQPYNQNSQKISTQLQANNNTIYAHLFNAFIHAMNPSIRTLHSPDVILQFPTLIQQLIKSPSIFNCTLSQNLVSKSIFFTVDQLVYQDENRGSIEASLKSKGYQMKGDIFIKGVNGVMLRILDNCQPIFVFTVFLKMLIKVIMGEQGNEFGSGLPISNRNKKIGLLMRCMNRLSNAHFVNCKETDKEKSGKQLLNWCKQFIYLSKEYLDVMGVMDLQQFQIKYRRDMQKQLGQNGNNKNSNNTEDSIIVCICNIFKYLHKRHGVLQKVMLSVDRSDPIMREERLMKQYFEKELGIKNLKVMPDEDDDFDKFELKEDVSQADEEFRRPDFNNHLPIKNNPSVHNVSHHLKTPSHLLSLSSSKGNQRQINQKTNAKIKAMIDLLSRNKTFHQGIQSLSNILKENPKFDYRGYFMSMNLQKEFIDKVTSLVQISPQQTSNQGNKNVLNPDIQDKLCRLKMKLEGINPSNQNPNFNSNKSVQEKEKTPHKIQDSQMHNNSLISRQNATPSHKKDGGASYTKQHDLKKRIQQMKNKVNMSTMANNRLR